MLLTRRHHYSTLISPSVIRATHVGSIRFLGFTNVHIFLLSSSPAQWMELSWWISRTCRILPAPHRFKVEMTQKWRRNWNRLSSQPVNRTTMSIRASLLRPLIDVHFGGGNVLIPRTDSIQMDSNSSSAPKCLFSDSLRDEQETRFEFSYFPHCIQRTQSESHPHAKGHSLKAGRRQEQDDQ